MRRFDHHTSSQQTNTDTFANSAGPDETARHPLSRQTKHISLQSVPVQMRRLLTLSSLQINTDTFTNSAGADETARDPFLSIDQYRYLCKQCRSSWDGSRPFHPYKSIQIPLQTVPVQMRRLVTLSSTDQYRYLCKQCRSNWVCSRPFHPYRTKQIPLQTVPVQSRRIVILSSQQTNTDTLANSAGPDGTACHPSSLQTNTDICKQCRSR